MKYVPGPSHGQFSGSQGNSTASHNRFGAYLRNRTIPVNPKSHRQLEVRSRFTDITAAWRTLTEAQRQEWRTLGEQMQRLDSLGVAYKLTGIQAFQSVNARRRCANLPVITDAPPLSGLPAISNLRATFALGGLGQHQLEWDGTLGTGDRLYIFATSAVSAGRNFFGDSQHRLILVSPPAVISPLDIASAYSARFPGADPGQKVSYRVLVVNADFVNSAELTAQTIVQP